MVDQTISYCMGCGVPSHLHGTCCGWTNANRILFPITSLEKQWKAIQVEAYNQMWGFSQVSVNVNICNHAPDCACSCSYNTIVRPAGDSYIAALSYSVLDNSRPIKTNSI